MIRILAAAIGLVLVAIVVLIAAVLLLFDPNDYRGMVADVVQAQTGRTLEIEGELSVEVMPCCGVAVEGVRLSNREGFSGDEFLRIESARLGLRVWPLILRREIVIGDVGLDGLELSLVRRQDGEANWNFDTPAPDEPQEPADAATDEPQADEQSIALASLTVAGLTVRDANVSFRDATTGADYRVENLNFKTSGIRIRQLVDVETSFRATDVSTGTTLQANVTSKALLDPDARSVTLANVNADIGVAGSALPAESLALTVKSDEVRFDVNNGSGQIEKFSGALQVAGVGLSVTGGGSFSGDASDLSGSLDIAPFSPRSLLVELGQPPLETSDPTALTSLQGTAQWSVNGDVLALDNILLRLDQTSIRGQASVDTRTRLGLRFDFNVDDIDLSRYLAPTAVQADGGAQSAGEPAPEMPVELIRSLDLMGRASIDRLMVSDVVMQNVDVGIRAEKGVVRIDPAVADLYGGRYTGKISLDVTGPQPSAVVDQSLTAVQAGGLLADFAKTANVEGVLEASINAAGTGRSRAELVRSLAGDVSIDLTDGVYKGVDLWHEIRKARALLKGKPAPAAPGEPETPIKTLAFSGRMDNGVLNTKRMVAEVPFIRLAGNGFVNLVEQNLDYRFNAKVHEKPVFADGEDLAGLQNVTIPLTVTGDLASPSIGIDLAELAKQEAVRKAGDLLMQKLGLDEPEPDPADAGQQGDQAPEQTPEQTPEETQGEPAQKDDARDLIRKGLRDLFEP